MPLDFLISALVTLLIVVDPIGLVPSYLPITHGLSQTRAAQCGAARDADRGSNPCRERAGRRLAVAHALDRFARLPHRRRITVVLDRIRNGVRRAHRAPVAAGRAGGRRAPAQYRRLSARHSIDGRTWRDHCDHPPGEPQRRRHPCGLRFCSPLSRLF